MASCRMAILASPRKLATITVNATKHMTRNVTRQKSTDAASARSSSFLGVCYRTEETLPYHRVRQLHTAVPQRFSALPSLATEVDLEISNDIEEEVIPVVMNFEQKLNEDEVVSSISEKGTELHGLGQAYTDFKSSVFMTFHEHSAFYDSSQ